MRHQAGDTAIAIQKGMNPNQPMVRRSRRKNGIRFSKPCVGVLEPLQKTRHGSGTDGDMPAYFDVAPS